MLLLAAIAAVVPSVPVQATLRIVRAQRVGKEEWQRSGRKREIVVRDGELKVILRLIELE